MLSCRYGRRCRLDRAAQRLVHIGARHQCAHRAQSDQGRRRSNAVRAVYGGDARRIVADARVKCVRRQRHVRIRGAESIGSGGTSGLVYPGAGIRHASVHAKARARHAKRRGQRCQNLRNTVNDVHVLVSVKVRGCLQNRQSHM